MSLIETITAQLAQGKDADIAKRFGINEDVAKTAVSAAVPLIVGALARNASKKDGADSLHKALEKDHDGSILDNITDLLGKKEDSDGDGILRHALGTKRSAVEQGLSKGTGIDLASAGSLLSKLAPVVMGALGKTQRENKLDSSGLARVLDTERKQAESGGDAGSPLGGLAGLLDRDDDGDMKDDLVDIGSDLLGGLFGKK